MKQQNNLTTIDRPVVVQINLFKIKLFAFFLVFACFCFIRKNIKKFGLKNIVVG